MFPPHLRTLLGWLLVCGIWSTVWLFIKIGVTDVPPFAFAAVRLLIALAILIPVVVLRRSASLLTARDRRLIGVTGVLLFTVNYALLYWAAQHISSGLLAVLSAITPAFALVIAQWLLPDEPVTLSNVLGLTIGVVGVALIFSDELRVTGARGAVACLAAVGSAFIVALGYVVIRARGTHLPKTTVMTGQILAGVIPLAALSLVTEGNPLAVPWTMAAVGSAVYLALAGSIVAFWLNYWLMHRIGPTRMLLTSILEPLIAVLLGAAVLGERLTSRVALGGALVLLSVALVMKRDRKH